MIYTSYFGVINKLPENCVVVSICGKAPDSYHGVEFKRLAPKKEFFMEWKKNHDNEFYCKNYKELVTDKQDPYQIIEDMINFLPAEIQQIIKSSDLPIWKNPDFHIVMVCYEIPSDFCHRHLAADWMCEAGIPVKELIV